MIRVARAKRQACGQSSIEAVIILPIFLLLSAAGVQLTWLLFAKHTLLSATNYVALYAATAPNDKWGQHFTFQQRIKPVQKGSLVVPKITLVTPEKDLSERVADYNDETEKYAFDPTYAKLQLKEKLEQGNDAAEDWLQLSNLTVDITWCFRLRVPGIAPILHETMQQGILAGTAGCSHYHLATGGYYMPLKAKVTVPLHKKREWHFKNS